MLWRHQFSESPALAGELLHIPERIPTFVATVLLSLAGDILYGVWVLASCRALKPHFRIIPHRQYCLPVMAHIEPLHSFRTRLARCTHAHRLPRRSSGGSEVPLCSLRIGQGGRPPRHLSYIARHHKTLNAARMHASSPAILRETSKETSYQAVR